MTDTPPPDQSDQLPEEAPPEVVQRGGKLNTLVALWLPNVLS